MTRVWCLPLVAVVLAAATGCSPSIQPHTSAPPSLTVDYRWNLFSDDDLHLSEGAAIAVDCFDPWSGAPCNDVRPRVADASVAKVFPAHLARRTGWDGVERPSWSRPGFVVAGVSRGETMVTFEGSGGTTVLRVFVD